MQNLAMTDSEWTLKSEQVQHSQTVNNSRPLFVLIDVHVWTFLLHPLVCTLMCAVLQIGTDSQVVKSIDIATMRKEDATFKVMLLPQAGCCN